MKYTIVYGDPRRSFIQQPYETLKEAQDRLAALKVKFAHRYTLVIVQVDDAGVFHDVTITQ